MSVGNMTGTNNTATSGRGWWKTSGPNQNYYGSLAAWAAWFNSDSRYGPAFMSDAVIVSVRIGVGTSNLGITSYVDSLRIVVNGYDWKWIFVNTTQCSGI